MGNQISDDSDAKKVGAAAGASTVGGIGYLAAGASAAEITGALATAGSLVGGGMAAGVAVTAAVPLAIGGIAYGLYKWLKD